MAIRILDPQVAAKIAAGEVIERPASVVKELLDNAIDAGSTQIRIETREGGLRLIRVTDNGCGIPAAEVELAFLPHATSKIQTADDLRVIRSLGFRGEALHAIAAVAQVTMVTKTADEPAATVLRLEGGKVVSRSSRGAPTGTAVSVENLFVTIPARLKFLKSAATETGHIANVAAQYALAHPGIKFTLMCDGRLSFQSTGSGDLQDVLVKVLGVETARGMIAIVPQPDEAGKTDGIRVSGYVSQPSVTRSTRAYLSLFVNGRWIQSRMLNYAVEEAYHTLLQVGRHPIAVLNIEVPFEQVDVNVHPSKTEVRFLREREVFASVQKAVRTALVESAGIPLATTYPREGESAGPARWGGPRLAVPVHGPTGRELGVQPTAVDADSSPSAPLVPPAPAASKLPPLRILGQFAQTYVIAEAPEGIYLIDQHTAHERVIYEALVAEHARMAVTSQGLLEPLVLEVTPRQRAVVEGHEQQLAELGFQIEPFGEAAIVVRAVPAILARGNVGQAVTEILDEMAEERGTLASWQEALIISVTCHSAVRAGQVLSHDEMRQLLAQLERTTLPRTCPHGRPTMILLSQAQLEREFGRR